MKFRSNDSQKIVSHKKKVILSPKYWSKLKKRLKQNGGLDMEDLLNSQLDDSTPGLLTSAPEDKQQEQDQEQEQEGRTDENAETTPENDISALASVMQGEDLVNEDQDDGVD